MTYNAFGGRLSLTQSVMYSHMKCSLHVSQSAVVEPEKRQRFKDQNDNV